MQSPCKERENGSTNCCVESRFDNLNSGAVKARSPEGILATVNPTATLSEALMEAAQVAVDTAVPLNPVARP